MLDPETKTIVPVNDPKAEKALAVLTDEAKKETDKVDALKTEGKIDETEANKQKESIVKKLQSKLQKKVAKYLGKLKAGPVFYKGQDIQLFDKDFVVIGLGRYQIQLALKGPETQYLITKGTEIDLHGFKFTVNGFSTDLKFVDLRIVDKDNVNINIDFAKTQKPNLN